MIKLEQICDIVKRSFCLYWKHNLFGYNTSCTRYDNVYTLDFLCKSLYYLISIKFIWLLLSTWNFVYLNLFCLTGPLGILLRTLSSNFLYNFFASWFPLIARWSTSLSYRSYRAGIVSKQRNPEFIHIITVRFTNKNCIRPTKFQNLILPRYNRFKELK